jgi:isoquinoline 1-oxidoreductase beta subunit
MNPFDSIDPITAAGTGDGGQTRFADAAPTDPSRRDFLKATGLTAGGLTIGISMAGGGALAKAGGSAGTDGFAPNAWLHIAPDGDTTLWCGRCEMGQGISTALPAAVADELEADWSRVRVLQGDASKEKYGPQNTGGSRSINLMLTPMRKAGAAGREMLVATAAAAWELPVADCYAKQHAVYNTRDDRSLGYGELATAAAAMPVPEAPTLKTPDQFRYIGKPLPRHDQREIVTGQRTYGADVQLPGMKYAAIRHVPVMGGKLKSVDKSAIDGMPGIAGVIEIPRFENPYGSLGGVAVAADTTWAAQQALAKLDIEWERGPHGDYDTDAYKAMLVRHVEQPCDAAFARGDVDAALSQATVRHAGTYVGGHLSHSPMEPMASAAWVTDERCEIWASTQDPQGIQQTIGKYLGRKPTDIIVHVMAAGGAFGRKFKCDYVQEAVAISRAIGAPVQLTWSREEDTRTGYYHSCSAQYLEAGLDADGNVDRLAAPRRLPADPLDLQSGRHPARGTRPSPHHGPSLRHRQRAASKPARRPRTPASAGTGPCTTSSGPTPSTCSSTSWPRRPAPTRSPCCAGSTRNSGGSVERKEQAARSLAVLDKAGEP